ncbi:MAG: hypothetical protein RMJ17_01635 [Candidatus Aenigmarchaeota archaeon]|nr:hypothetical protein [Candidatus Aenigmarchaeota archaeon]MDW8149279.1 hypothetical protein [Candidatus Aenigmarchaeota archaeon]
MVAIKAVVEFIIIILALVATIYLIVTNWNVLSDRIIEWIKNLGGLLKIG